MKSIYQILKQRIVQQKADQRVHIQKLMQKYFSDGKQEISRRDFKEFILELVTNKTPEEIISLHKKAKLSRKEKKVVYMENIIFQYMDQHKERKFKKEYAELIIQNKSLENFISSKVLENTKKNRSEQHDHHRKKEILEKVEEAVQRLTGGEL